MLETLETVVVKEPKLSLKRFCQYTVATDNGKRRILEGCKYPKDYVPRFYEIARKFTCDVFSANFPDHELYFEEFKRQALVLKNEAKSYPVNKDAHKNRICSANALEAIVAMSQFLIPILNQYTLNSNLTNRKDSILKNDVKIGSMADMILFEDRGVNQIGFLKFNFTKEKLSKDEANTALFVLKTFFEKKGIHLDLKSCFLVDVFAWRVYTAYTCSYMERGIEKSTLEIKDRWPLI